MTLKRPFAPTLASTADRHMKKSRTEAAAAYDRVDVTVDDILIYDPEWVPLYDVFDRKPNVRPTYKGKANSPLQIDHMEFYDQLHPCEVNIASQLRLQPKQYLMCKRSLILGAQDSYKNGMPFRKSDAQKLCRIDVNKVSHLWALFARLGWLEPHTPVYHQ
ncbi:Homeodomain-like protein [Circinella umbellata]|nr:Homeodomain-like protein [Circinella umbellata]